MGFAGSNLGLAYGLASWSTGDWFSDMHTDRSQIEIATQAKLTARVLDEIYGE